jgi:GTP-binding protein
MRHRRPGTAARHRARATKERSLTGPTFVGSFPRADVALALALPEVAFLGRSNVGKSSLINAFVGQRIARISGTPGKTRALNVFQVHLVRGTSDVGADGAPGAQPRTTHHALYLLDLPGYGYARAAKGELTAFRGLLKHVVTRQKLAGVVWLLDIRRDPSPDDRAMQDTFAAAGTRVLAAVTKSDKLPRGQRLAREAALRDALGMDSDQLILTSAHTGDGIPDLRAAVAALIA